MTKCSTGAEKVYRIDLVPFLLLPDCAPLSKLALAPLHSIITTIILLVPAKFLTPLRPATNCRVYDKPKAVLIRT